MLGGDAEAVKSRFAATWNENMNLPATLKSAVAALAGADRSIPVGDLEVGILEDRGVRRTFLRLSDIDVSGLLAE